MAEEKLSLSLDDIISKTSKRGGKPDGPAKAGRAPRRVSKGDGKAPAPVGKARALGVAVKNATKRQAPRRTSGGARREVQVVDYVEVRATQRAATAERTPTVVHMAKFLAGETCNDLSICSHAIASIH